MTCTRSLFLFVCIGFTCGCSKPGPPATSETSVAGTSASKPSETLPPSEAAFEPSVNERLRAQIRTGSDPAVAAQLFSIEVTPLPGVILPAGKRDKPLSGTFAAIQLLAVFNQLPEEQQRAAAPFLGLTAFSGAQQNRPAFNRAPMTLPPDRRQAWRSPAPRLLHASYSPVAAALPASQDELLRAYFAPMFKWANQSIAKLIGRSNPLSDNFDLDFFSDSTEAYALTTDFAIRCVKHWSPNCREDNPDKAGEKKSAPYIDLGQRLPNCHTALNVSRFLNEPNEVILSIVTHEVFHCYQMHAIASLAQAQQIKGWLHDGEATWVQNVIVPEAVFQRMQDIWREYLFSPKGHLFDRGYPAYPFFGHVSDAAGAAGTEFVARNLLDAFVRGLNSDDDAFTTIVGQYEDAVLDSWASSYFLAHPDKPIWDAKGPGSKANIPGSGPSPESVTAFPGGSVSLPAAAKWELSLVRLDSTAEIVEVTMDAGHLALIDAADANNFKFIDGEPVRFCTIEKCVCSQDSEGEVPPTIPARAPFDVGLTAGRQRAAAHARGYALKDYCKKREKDPPSGPGGSKPPGDSSSGWDPPPSWEPPQGKASSDPHIATLDGRWFDLQAIGEFVLSRSTVDDFLIQVRFGSRSTDRVWSTPVAMATHAGKDRIVVSLNLAAAEPVPVLRINGKVTNEAIVNLTGASVRQITTEWGPGYTVTFADGTRVGANLTARDGLSTWVNPSPTRRGKLTGLLGNDDGDKGNDPVVKGGKVLGQMPGYDELYKQFANSWRITQADSLFDYGDRETTATFTDATYPERDRPAAPAAVVAAATQLCKDSGVADPDLVRNCTFDVAATGKRRYVSTYLSGQRRIDYAAMMTGSAADTLKGSGTVTRQSSAGLTRDRVFEGRVADAKQPVAVHFDGGKGDIIYIDPRNCVELRFTGLNGPDGKKLTASGYAATSGLCGSRFVLPADGTYTFALNPFSDTTGEYRYPLVTARPDRITNIAPGDVLQGTIGARAERDVYVLTVRGKTRVSLDPQGCAGNFDIVVTYGNDESIGAGGMCRFSTIELPKAGSYRFVVNPFNNTTGDYRVRLKQE